MTVVISMLVLMCLWWKFQYYKGVFQTVLCVSNSNSFYPQISGQGDCSHVENGRNMSDISKVRQLSSIELLLIFLVKVKIKLWHFLPNFLIYR